MKPQPDPQRLIAPIVVRYLRRCYLERQIDHFTAAGMQCHADCHLLDDLGYWIVDPPAKPAVSVQLVIDWMMIQDAIDAAREASVVDASDKIYTCATAEFVDLALQSVRKCDYETIKLLGLTETDINFLTEFKLAALHHLEACPFTVTVSIDVHRASAASRQRVRQYQATADCITLIRCGATHPMLSEITGISTHEFASLRRVVGVKGHSRTANRTYQEELSINELLNTVCGNRPPQIKEYLEMCALTNNTVNLGQVYAEVNIRWPPSRESG